MTEERPLKTFNELLFENEKKWGDFIYLRQPINGVWHDFTWREVMQQARKITTFLKSQGLKKGDKVTILSKNCAEWFIADFAIALGGFISVPLFSAQHPETIGYILKHAEVKLIFVGKLDHWHAQEKGIPADIPRVAFPYENSMPAQYQWKDLLEQYQPEQENYIPDLNDLYTIVYTSGTTGNPKGVMIPFSAQAECQNLVKAEKILPLESQQIYFSYLPLGHITERIAIEHGSLMGKTTVAFPESLATFPQNLRDISPTLFFAVPRIWTQFQKGILAKIPQKKLETFLKIPLLNSLIKRKIRRGLGLNRTQFNVTGSAPISPALLIWFKNLGIEILEGYGRSEDLTIASLNYPGHSRIGTVGKPRIGVEIKIAENGEILTKSKMMMSGYFKDPEATKKAFTGDGFIRTGDMGYFDKDGYLIINGRINDSFKTDKGEFVNPIPIEAKFGVNTQIEQLCLIGMTLPQPVLLVGLSEAAKKLDSDLLAKSLRGTLEQINPGLTKFEKIAHLLITKEPWTVENALLTPTLKTKRQALHNKYIHMAQKIQGNPEPIIWE